MAASRSSYRRLRQEVIFEEDYENRYKGRSTRNWFARLRRGQKNRKFRLKIKGLRRFFKLRRVKVSRPPSWTKFMKRLKESQNHLGDLFAGSYLFMQVTPSSFKNSSIQKTYAAQNNNISYYSQTDNYKLPGLPERYIAA